MQLAEMRDSSHMTSLQIWGLDSCLTYIDKMPLDFSLWLELRLKTLNDFFLKLSINIFSSNFSKIMLENVFSFETWANYFRVQNHFTLKPTKTGQLRYTNAP